MTYADKRRQRWERLKLTLIAKKYLAWLVATGIFLFFVGVSGWAEWLTFTAAIFCIDAYSKQKVTDNAPPPISYPDGGP